MSEPSILNAKGVFKGQLEKGVQFYHVVGEDADGDQVILIFGCGLNYAETIDKSFTRLFPILFKAEEIAPSPSQDIIDITAKQETELGKNVVQFPTKGDTLNA